MAEPESIIYFEIVCFDDRGSTVMASTFSAGPRAKRSFERLAGQYARVELRQHTRGKLLGETMTILACHLACVAKRVD